MFEFDRPQSGERAVLVHVSPHVADPDALHEFSDLATSAGAEVLELMSVVRVKADSKLFVGKGKAEEIQALVSMHEAELVIFDNALSPSQERNLEKLFECRVLDRTGLILDIFAQRARSFEGKLQVELAQLRHLSTRLVRGWTHLERQKGGIGLRGPGETQLETDRRLLNNRIDKIRSRLERVDGQREQGRRARRRAEVATVSLVGYTNAGKSSLFNRLTEAGVFAEDQLFATLDPTLRRLELPDNTHVVLADTVGFVSNLPHELVAAFKSTLQETTEATLLLHVVDAASHQRELQIREVESVLEQIGADKVPCIQVFNKIDLLDESAPRIEQDQEGHITRVWLSAMSGAGMEQLLATLVAYFHTNSVRHQLRLAPQDGRLRALLFERAQIHAESFTDEGGWELDVELPRRDFDQLLSHEPSLKDTVVD